MAHRNGTASGSLVPLAVIEEKMESEIYRNQGGHFIKGVLFKIVLKDDTYHLIDLKVYADGYIDCLGSITIDKLKELLATGKLTRSLPQDARLFIPYIGYIHAAHPVPTNRSDDRFIDRIQDTIRQLNAVRNEKNDCVQLFKAYLLEPTELNLNNLRQAYLRLPDDRKAVFEIEAKDPLIRLMNTCQDLSPEERKYLLRDYFEGEWLEMK